MFDLKTRLKARSPRNKQEGIWLQYIIMKDTKILLMSVALRHKLLIDCKGFATKCKILWLYSFKKSMSNLCLCQIVQFANLHPLITVAPSVKLSVLTMDVLQDSKTRLPDCVYSLGWKLLDECISQRRFLASGFASTLCSQLCISVSSVCKEWQRCIHLS